MSDLGRICAYLLASAGASAAATLLLIRFAPPLGLLDVPGGRKEHSQPVPLVGGLAIFAALLGAALLTSPAGPTTYLIFALSIVVAVGFWDDMREIRPGLKFAVQIAACVIMIWGAGIHLSSVGNLIGWRTIGLSVFAIPITIFAVVGLVNAINMMDGVDGVAGSVALVAFAWYALVAAASGLEEQASNAVLICGSISGFLIFNLRLPWQPRARAFLGDAGSLMLGFALAWFAIDLTQGPGRTFPPIAALWVLLLPLADCVSLVIRRAKAGMSPFVADQRHIHHYLLRRGFSHSETLAILVGVSTAFGAVAYFAWIFRVPESFLFYPFFFGFFAYHAWIQREWRLIDRLQGAEGGGNADKSGDAVTAR